MKLDFSKSIKNLILLLLLLLIIKKSYSNPCRRNQRQFYIKRIANEEKRLIPILYEVIANEKADSKPRTRQDFYNALKELDIISDGDGGYSHFVQSLLTTTISLLQNCVTFSPNYPRNSLLKDTLTSIMLHVEQKEITESLRQQFRLASCWAYNEGVLPLSKFQKSEPSGRQSRLQTFFQELSKDPVTLADLLGFYLPHRSIAFVFDTALASDVSLFNVLAKSGSIARYYIIQLLQEKIQEAEIFDAGVDRTHLFTRTATIEGNSTSSCYKPVIEAILNTIEACTPYSNIYVISRSVSSDIKDISKVFEAAKSKHITINVLYFDKGCDNNEFEDLLPIVSNTGGVILQSFEVFEDFLQLISDTNFQGQFLMSESETTELIDVTQVEESATKLTNLDQEELLKELNKYSSCHRVIKTTLDETIYLLFNTKYADVDVVLIRDPEGRLSAIEVDKHLIYSINTDKVGEWQMCSIKDTVLQVGSSQLVDFALDFTEISDYTQTKFRTANGPKECFGAWLAIRSQNLFDIGDSCPLYLNLLHPDGSLSSTHPLLNCDVFLQTEATFLPQHSLYYQIEGCDDKGNRFRKNLIAPIYHSTSNKFVKVYQQENAKKIYFTLREGEILKLQHFVQNFLEEPVMADFRISKKNSINDEKFVLDPQVMGLEPKEMKTMTVEYSISDISVEITDQLILTGSVISQSGREGSVCRLHHFISLEKVENVCGCINGNCIREIDVNDTEVSYCVCSEGFVGDTCSSVIGQSEPNCTVECQNGATCIPPDSCQCNSGYTGELCNSAICDPECKNGHCTSPNMCSCMPGYGGATCETPICDPPCQNNGKCTSPNACDCPEGFGGNQCEFPPSQCSSPCFNGGTCIGQDTCKCEDGYTGKFCDSAICSQGCMNEGICIAPETCMCSEKFSGSKCDIPICNPNCVNGNCTSPNQCTCEEGYTGEVCTEPTCFQQCRNNGTCSGPNVCTCTAEYTGLFCDEPVCSDECVQGSCVAPDTCDCNSGYIGPTCSELNTSSCDCQNGATCITPGVCSCVDGFTGHFCETPFCNPPCQNGGLCDASSMCTCTSNYTGIDCTVPICSPECLNGGNCTGVNKCTCTEDFNGALCEIPICEQPCLNGGQCSLSLTCICPPYHFGTQCEDRRCSDFAYFVGFLSNFDSSLDHIFHLYTEGETPVDVAIVWPQNNLPVNVKVYPDRAYEVHVAPSQFGYTLKPSINRIGYFAIETYNQEQISVLIVNEGGGSMGVYPALPLSFGRDGNYEFYTLGFDPYEDPKGSFQIQNVENVIAIIAPYDNTTIQFKPTIRIVDFIEGVIYGKGKITTFTLDRGQSFLVKHTQDLSGSYIHSNKWITVLSGHECGTVPNDRLRCDHLPAQIPPTTKWGTRFVVPAMETQILGFALKIVSSQAGNNVTLMCTTLKEIRTTIQYYTLDEGGFVFVDVPEPSDCTIESTFNTLIGQLSKGAGENEFDGDPLLAIVPNIELYIANIKFSTVDSKEKSRKGKIENYFSLVIEKSWFDQDDIKFDGDTLASVSGGDSREITFSDKTAYVIVVPKSPVEHGIHTVQHTDSKAEMALLSYGFEGFWSYGYWASVERALSCDSTLGL